HLREDRGPCSSVVGEQPGCGCGCLPRARWCHGGQPRDTPGDDTPTCLGTPEGLSRSVAGSTYDRQIMSSDFVHLHVHTEYSMLDGACGVKELFAEAQRLGQTALATTDHGYLFGAYDFWRTAKDYDVKPIIGVEAYVTPGTSRHDKSRVRWGEESQRQDDV